MDYAKFVLYFVVLALYSLERAPIPLSIGKF